MKRVISLFLALTLFFSVSSLTASASEIESPAFDLLAKKAAKIFPEYAASIQNSRIRTNQFVKSDSPRTLKVNETRQFSETEYITYREYSDGLILLSSNEYTADSTVVDYVTGSTYRNITINIRAACSINGYSGCFCLDGVSYSLRNSDYDIITNPGTMRLEGCCEKASRITYIPEETDTNYANIVYYLEFVVGPTGYYTVRSNMFFEVGEDTAVLDHLENN